MAVDANTIDDMILLLLDGVVLPNLSLLLLFAWLEEVFDCLALPTMSIDLFSYFVLSGFCGSDDLRLLAGLTKL